MVTVIFRPPAQNARGAAHMLAGVVLFSFTDAMVKWLAADYPVHQLVFFRTVFALLACLFFVARSGELRPFIRAGRWSIRRVA